MATSSPATRAQEVLTTWWSAATLGLLSRTSSQSLPTHSPLAKSTPSGAQPRTLSAPARRARSCLLDWQPRLLHQRL